MAQRVAISLSAAGVLVAVVVGLATVNPPTASSNISEWLRSVRIDAPLILQQPNADLVLCCFAGAILVAVLAYWGSRYIVAVYRRRREQAGWKRREFVSIDEAAELIALQGNTPAKRHRLRLEVLNELTALVRDGRIPIANEKTDHKRSISSLADGDLRRYPTKEAHYDAILDRRTVDEVARGRNWALPPRKS